MKKRIHRIIVLTMIFSLILSSLAYANNATVPSSSQITTSNVTPDYTEGDFILVENGSSADIYVDSTDHNGVVRATNDLQEDVKRVTGVTPSVEHSTNQLSEFSVIIGTIGKSSIIDDLIGEGKLDVEEVEGKWEASVTQVVEQPLPNVKTGLVIAGSDERGTIYGIYNLSEKMGVSPWYWWADVPIKYKDRLIIPQGIEKMGEPSVKYRGIFINDERNLQVWSKRNIEPDKNIGPETYKLIYELMLRLKANFLWPAMHPYSDHFNKYEENYELADEYGIVIGSTHTDMMLRNNMGEWDDWASNHLRDDGTKPTYDYTVDPEIIEAYWDESVKKHSSYDIGWSLGMRGIHDTPFVTENASTTEEKIEVMEQIFADQQKMLRNRVNPDLSEVLQLFTPYKEVLDLYDAGLDVPEDITLIWPDDNYGYMRRLPNEDEQQRSGGNGLYYHFSYNNGRNNTNPNRSYLWLSTTPLPTIWEELNKAYEHNVRELWVVNVGDIKPHELQTEFFMDMAWDISKFNQDNIHEYLVNWVGETINPEYKNEIADIIEKYHQYTLARRPYFLEKGVFSDVNYGDEAQQQILKYSQLVDRVDQIYNKLPEEQRDAFYQLVVYPVKGAYYMNKKFYYANKNELYEKQGRGYSLNLTAGAAEQAELDEEKETDYYNTELANGKWNGIMSPYPDTYIAMAPKVPEVSRKPLAPTSGMGVAAEGQTTGTEIPLTFSTYTRDSQFIDIYNTGFLQFDWEATTSDNWIKLNKSEGTVSAEERIWVSIDWDNVPVGNSTGVITINGADETRQVQVSVSNPESPERSEIEGYMEANGYVSIQAEHYSDKINRSGTEWQKVDGLGRNGDAMISYPVTASSVIKDIASTSSELQYKIYFESAGTFPVEVHRMPTLDETGKVRLAIGLDDDDPIVMEGQNKASGGKWVKNVMEGIEKLTTEITVSKPGYHTLKVWMVDPGIAIEKLVIDTGGVKSSYFGPPESFNPVHNPNPAIVPAELPKLDAPPIEVEMIMENLLKEAKVWSKSVSIGSDIGQYSPQLKEVLDEEIQNAENTMEDPHAKDEEVIAAINNLDQSLKEFKDSRRMEDEDYRYLVFENFDSYPTDSVPLDWNADIGNGTLSIVEVPDNDNKSLKLYGGTGDNKVSAQKEFTPFDGTITLEQKVRVDTPNDFVGLPYFYDSEGNIAHSLRVINGQMQVSDGSSWINLLSPEPGRWYDLKLTINTVTNKYDLYIDGEQKVREGNLRSQASNISALDYYSDIGESTEVYLDEVKLYFDKNMLTKRLEDLIDHAESLLNGSVVGDELGQYPSEDVINVFTQSIEDTKDELSENPDDNVIQSLLTSLQMSISKFMAARNMTDEHHNYYVYDHFNNYSTGDVPGMWSVLNGNGSVSISNHEDKSQDKFIHIEKTAAGGGRTSAEITFEPLAGSVAIEAKIKAGEGPTVKLAPYIYDGVGNIAASIMFDSDGYIKARTGSSWTSVQKYEVDEWYKLKMVLNLNDDTFDLTIDDNEKLVDAHLRTSVEAINRIEFYLDQGSTSLSVDDVKVYQTKPEWPNWGNGPFIEQDGHVVIEAETALKYSDDAYITEGINNTWGGVDGDSFGALKAFFDTGDHWTDTSDLIGKSPEVSYNTNISNPGTYNVWLLAKAVDNGSDSIHVGLDGEYKFSYTQFPVSNQFVWSNTGEITIDEQGLYRLNLWAREDGIVIDKIYLTSGDEVPEGLGPILKGDRTAIPIDGDNLDEIVAYGMENNWIENEGIKNSLQAKVNDIQKSIGDFVKLQETFNAFKNQVEALAGKKIDEAFAQQLLHYTEIIQKKLEEMTPISASSIKTRVERFAEEEAFESDRVVRSLTMHLTVVRRYEEQEQAEKVIKHMKGFKHLLDHQKDNAMMSEEAYKVLYADSELLIKKWQ